MSREAEGRSAPRPCVPGQYGVRFAPSPTGTLHMGNLRTAWVSHFLARALGLPWVVRYEDIDEPRNALGALQSQRHDLEQLGLVADVTLLQSQHRARHLDLFLRAVRDGQVYPCFCSRKDVRDTVARIASAPHGAIPVYSGHCRSINNWAEAFAKSKLPTIAWRFRTGHAAQDFVVARTARLLTGEGWPDASSFQVAYNWACAIDDFDGKYALVVRAVDLASVVEHQRDVQRWLARSELQNDLESNPKHPVYPAVYHCALVVNDDGSRLEKRSQGVTLRELEARGISPKQLAEAFHAGFDPPELKKITAGQLLFESHETIRVREILLTLAIE